MNTQLHEGTVLGSPLWDSRLLVCSDQDQHGRVRIALADVRHLAGTGSTRVWAVDCLHSAPVEVDVQEQLEEQGWEAWGTALPGAVLDVACGRGGGDLVVDNADGGVE